MWINFMTFTKKFGPKRIDKGQKKHRIEKICGFYDHEDNEQHLALKWE